MTKIRMKAETRLALELSGFCLSACWQPPRDDGRKLKHVAEPGDPYIAQLFFPDDQVHPVPWFASFIQWGKGATADEAIMDALGRAAGVQGRCRHLGAACDQLTEALHVTRTGCSYA